jgi:hypothetical protein
VINACRPYKQLATYSPVVYSSDKWRKKVRQRWGENLFVKQ